MAERVYPPVIAFARLVFRLQGLRFTVEGEEHVPRTGGAVMAINHIGYFDFTYAGYAAVPAKRLVRFMAKKEVFDHKISGPLLRGMHHIPVDRAAGAGAYRAAVEALRSGEIVGVFPEATISRSFELKGFKTGAARMAAESGVPIVPVVVWGSQRVWTKGLKKRLGRHKVPIHVYVGEPMTVAANADVVAVTAELKERMHKLLLRAQDAYPDVPAGDGDRWWLPTRLGGTAPSPEEAAVIEESDVRKRAERHAAKKKA